VSQAPVFFIGFPRSGTTLISEAFFRHEALGWPSAYSEWFPQRPWLNVVRRLLDNRVVHLPGRKGGPYIKTIVGNRLLPQPAEAYRFWDHYAASDFSRSYLLDRTADKDSISRTRNAVRKLTRWQGRPRFAAKITGPSRIQFLNSIFPDARFVHVIRDGKAAVHSLLNVGFWREKGGLEGPFWAGGLSQVDLQTWQANSKDPGVLAALQWRRVLEVARLECTSIPAARYREIRYEDFLKSPHVLLRSLYEFCGLDDSERGHKFLENGPDLVNFNDRYRAEFSDSYVEKLSGLMQPMLAQFGYSSFD
jgi:hypothetical protein